MDERTTRFIETVTSMRTAQKSYFEKIAKARKTKLPADWAASAEALKRSKALETEVDRTITIFFATPLTKVSETNDTNH